MTEETSRRLTLIWRFAAAPEQVFDAWTRPDIAARWLFTGPDSQAHTTELDLRIGGRWTITDRRDGVDYVAIGEYREIDRPRRLVFTFGMPQFSPEFAMVAVALEPSGDGCLMTLVQEPVPPEAQPPLDEGWRPMFTALETLL